MSATRPAGLHGVISRPGAALLLALAVAAGAPGALSGQAPTAPNAVSIPVGDPRTAGYAAAMRQSLLDLEASDSRPRASREDVLNALGRSPTAVIEVAQMSRWLAPVLDAMAEAVPADKPFHADLSRLAEHVRRDLAGPGVLALDNRVAHWSVAASSPRPHTLAVEFAGTFDLASATERSTVFDAGEVALVALYRRAWQAFPQANPLEAVMTMVTDSRVGLLVATSSPGEANRASTILAGSRLSGLEPQRLNERLRQALAQPPGDDAAVRGALDLSRALRSVEPQMATWVQRTLGLPRREGTLIFEAREEPAGVAFRLRARPVGTTPPQETPPATEPAGGLESFFAELPRDQAQLVVAMSRDEAALVLAAYEDLVPAAGNRTDPLASQQIEAEIERLAGVSFRSTITPLLGECLGVVVYPPPSGAASDTPSAVVLVIETQDEVTLARLAERLLAQPGASSPSLGEALGLSPGQGIEIATARERLALAAGPEARARLGEWRRTREAEAPPPPIPPLQAPNARMLGWVNLATLWPPTHDPTSLPLWWITGNQPGGELEIHGLVEGSLPRLAQALVENVPILKSHDPEVDRRLALSEARLQAIDAAMLRYWKDRNEISRGVEQLVGAGVGLSPEDVIDPFANPPQPLLLRPMGSSQWVIIGVGPDGVVDPEDYLYNPRHGAFSRGDLHHPGGLSATGVNVISDAPGTP